VRERGREIIKCRKSRTWYRVTRLGLGKYDLSRAEERRAEESRAEERRAEERRGERTSEEKCNIQWSELARRSVTYSGVSWRGEV
jgi:hypothetical protein